MLRRRAVSHGCAEGTRVAGVHSRKPGQVSSRTKRCRQAVSLARTKHRAAEIADGKARGRKPKVDRIVTCSARDICVAVSSAQRSPVNDAAFRVEESDLMCRRPALHSSRDDGPEGRRRIQEPAVQTSRSQPRAFCLQEAPFRKARLRSTKCQRPRPQTSSPKRCGSCPGPEFFLGLLFCALLGEEEKIRVAPGQA